MIVAAQGFSDKKDIVAHRLAVVVHRAQACVDCRSEQGEAMSAAGSGAGMIDAGGVGVRHGPAGIGGRCRQFQAENRLQSAIRLHHETVAKDAARGDDVRFRTVAALSAVVVCGQKKAAPVFYI